MSQQDMDLLLWLHAEAVWRYQTAWTRATAPIRDLRAGIAELETEVEWLRREVEFEAKADHTLHVNFGFARPRPCACLTSEGAAQVAADPRWSLPLCAVHPEVER